MNEYVASTALCPGVLFVRVIEAHVPESLLSRSFLKNSAKNNKNELCPTHSNTQSSHPNKSERSARWSLGKFGRKKEARVNDGNKSGKASAWTSCVLEFDDVEMEIPLHSFVREETNMNQNKPTISTSNISVAVVDEHVKPSSVQQEQEGLKKNQPAAESPVPDNIKAESPSVDDLEDRANKSKLAYGRMATFRPSQSCVDRREHEVIFEVPAYFGSARVTAQLQRVAKSRAWQRRRPIRQTNTKAKVALGTGWTPLHRAVPSEHKKHIEKLALQPRGNAREPNSNPRELIMPPMDERRQPRPSKNNSTSTNNSNNFLRRRGQSSGPSRGSAGGGGRVGWSSRLFQSSTLRTSNRPSAKTTTPVSPTRVITESQENEIFQRRLDATTMERVKVFLDNDVLPYEQSVDGGDSVPGLTRSSKRRSLSKRGQCGSDYNNRVVLVLEMHFSPMPSSKYKLVSNELHRAAFTGNFTLMHRLAQPSPGSILRGSTTSSSLTSMIESVWLPTQDSLAMTPLHIAARLGHVELVKHIHKSCSTRLLGLCVKKHSTRGQTIIHQAVLGQNPAVLTNVLEIVNTCATSHAIRMSLVSRAQDLLDLGLDDLGSSSRGGGENEYDIFDRRDCDGLTALARACKGSGNTFVNRDRNGAMRINENGHPSANIKTDSNSTSKAFGLVKLLVTHGADVSICDLEGNTPLVLACKSGNAEVVKYLLSLRSEDGPSMMSSVRCRPNMPNKLGEFAIHIAAAITPFTNGDNVGVDSNSHAHTTNTHVGTVSTHAHTPNQTHTSTINSQTINTHTRTAYTHTHASNTDPNTPTTEPHASTNINGIVGQSASAGVVIVKALLANGSSLTVRDRNGCTALHHAARAGNLEVVKVLVQAIYSSIDGFVNEEVESSEESSGSQTTRSENAAEITLVRPAVIDIATRDHDANDQDRESLLASGILRLVSAIRRQRNDISRGSDGSAAGNGSIGQSQSDNVNHHGGTRIRDNAHGNGGKENVSRGRGIGTDGRGGDGKRHVPWSLFLCRDAHTFETASEAAQERGFDHVVNFLAGHEEIAREHEEERKGNQGGSDVVGESTSECGGSLGFGWSWTDTEEDITGGEGEGERERFVFVDEDAPIESCDDCSG